MPAQITKDEFLSGVTVDNAHIEIDMRKIAVTTSLTPDIIKKLRDELSSPESE